jgi:UDP-N-acetylmuramoyl-L-alanyl-D-glutamate--2,6-diaminopimelate ligase
MVQRVPGRLERLECGQPFSVFVDAAQTAQALTLAIKTVRQVTSGRVFAVFGSETPAAAAHAALLGRVLERGTHVPVLTSGNPGQSATSEAIHELLDGFERPHKAHVIPSRTAAIRFALSRAEVGDCVLIAGRECSLAPASSSQAMSDDREIACRWLYEQGEREITRQRFRVVG